MAALQPWFMAASSVPMKEESPSKRSYTDCGSEKVVDTGSRRGCIGRLSEEQQPQQRSIRARQEANRKERQESHDPSCVD